MTNCTIVFGGSGFIGSHLIGRLIAEGVKRIVSVDIKPPLKRQVGVDYIIGDVRDLTELTVPGTVECIYNLAAVHTTPGHATHEYYETNVAGATQITAFARRLGVREIIFTSSISIYGPSEETKSENAMAAPDSAYGWSKLLAEGIHRAWVDEDMERRLMIIRPAVIFGPGEGGNFRRMAKLLHRGFFVYPGRKDTIKACFYIDDLLDAIFFAKSRGERFILFNACYPDRYTIEDIVEIMRQVHFSTARTFLLPRLFVVAVASFLKPLSIAGLGLHPDRVKKLVRSTDVVPGWLASVDRAIKGRLPAAIERWKRETSGRFD